MRFTVKTPDQTTHKYDGDYSVPGNGTLQVRPVNEPTITYSAIGWLSVEESENRAAPIAQFA